jgi:hypothetical protein
MSTHDLYTAAPADDGWSVPMAGAARFNWEYDDGRDRLLALYAKGKDKQWDAVKRIDWGLEVDPYDVLGVPDESLAIYGTRFWDRFGPDNIRELRLHSASWQFSQFLHGEQGAMICAARIVESVPDIDAKFYAATQTMDEARHAELYARFLHEKVGLLYPINSQLQALLNDTLSDSRWDMPYLGMQVLIEGLALAAFGLLRDMTSKPLPKQILAYVMQDEARHVAFGRMALRDYYKQLTEAELREREEFGLSPGEVREITGHSEYNAGFQSLLFSRLVPCVKDIGLWSDRLRAAYADMGVLDYARADLEALMSNDEEIAEKLDEQRFAAEEAGRAAEVAEVIAGGAAG